MENLILNILSNRGSVWIDDSSTDAVESFDDIAIRALQETIADLSAEFSEDISQWNWGKMHTFTLAHPMGKVEMLDKVLGLNRGPYEMPGSFHTICPYSYPWSDLYHVNHGASHRHIFDASNWDNSKTVIPTGTSGIPASEYYCNQTELYTHNKYHKDNFSKKMVENSRKYKSILNRFQKNKSRKFSTQIAELSCAVIGYRGKINSMNTSNNNKVPPPIYVVSGGRGIAGNNMVQSLLIQYPENNMPVKIVPQVETEDQVFDIVMKAKSNGGVITHTMVNSDLRRKMNDLCKEMGG